ncbi:class I ribonucleotide reductase maintenance protein YfaE [Arsukibacterium sp.]|uniref:class I ribonucleotide reductase maintenance protein YfaE n=1 Tax=Arsukibacterium sp. TaxID=1977258 RepID=UPI00299D15F6|nr:class I ribonucleotide reductase maintenance protein YfaE [Arsukibacterium sp.]MDX1537842.1 class I ribonucleotide reductase maintenance protein YfaE [Arsukibacterium sp.]
MPQIIVADHAAINFDGSQPTILQSLEQQQDVSYQCREGYCGACRCKLISGRIQYLHEPLAFVRHGEFLPCCSVPVTDIKIEIP